jgi:transposase-like protein
MKCPECISTHIRKNGIQRDKQNHLRVDYGRQFLDKYAEHRGYSDDVRQECLKIDLLRKSQALSNLVFKESS